MTEQISKAKSAAERNVKCTSLIQCTLSSAVDPATAETFITLRPNPNQETVVYAMTREMAVQLAEGLLSQIKETSN